MPVLRNLAHREKSISRERSVLFRGNSVMTWRKTSMAAKTVREMTLVRVPYRQSRVNHTHSCLQQFASVPNSNPFQICMRRQADRFRKCTRKVEGAARSQCSQLRQRYVL
jgi:hypothetical protein